MVSTDAKAAVLLVVGIGLLLNPVYFATGNLDGSGTEITYEVEPVPNETVAEGVVPFAEQTLSCGSERACALETEIAESGELTYDGTIQDDRGARWDPHSLAWDRYSLVQLDGEYYVPEQEQTGNETVLTHRQVSTMEALEHIAVPSDETSAHVRGTVETGSITLFDHRIPEFERNDPIEHDGEIYSVTRRSYSSNTGDSVLFWRLFLSVLGVGFVGTAWHWRGRSVSDRRRGRT